MAFLVGLILALALLYFWLIGHWFARVLMFLMLSPLFAATVAVVAGLLGGNQSHPNSEPSVAIVLVAFCVGAGGVIAWFVSMLPIYYRRRQLWLASDQRPIIERVTDRSVGLAADYDELRSLLVEAGTKEFGTEAWNKHTAILHNLNATGNTAFMLALVELPNGPRIVKALAQDTDVLVGMLRDPPTVMVAKLRRMAAELARQP
jgi:hypothetical protein